MGSETPSVRQDYILQPESFCSKHKLPPPQLISTARGLKKDIFVKLATMAAFPRFQAAWMIFYRGRHLRILGLVGEDGSYYKIGVGLAFFAITGFWLFRYVRQQQV